MEVLTIRRRERMVFDIYVKMGENKEDRTVIAATQSGKMITVPFDSELPVYARIPEDIFEAIVTDGRKHFPPETSDVREHLSDAVDVRDRMIALVEKSWEHWHKPVLPS